MNASQEKASYEKFWRIALERSSYAKQKKSLIPLETKIIKTYVHDDYYFELRCIISKISINTLKETPTPNPFLPWNKDLEIARIGNGHTLILNKYPVQIGHMLLITNSWAPQNGWLTMDDMTALKIVDQDTSGLWFFNSCPIAGASQPHRHLQLLRRKANDQLCPRSNWFDRLLNNNSSLNTNTLSSSYALYRATSDDAFSLHQSYLKACEMLGIGTPYIDKAPKKPYNLLISRNWICVIKRSKEGMHGFSINGLGFAGYLLATKNSNIKFLDEFGPENLLDNIVDPT